MPPRKLFDLKVTDSLINSRVLHLLGLSLTFHLNATRKELHM